MHASSRMHGSARHGSRFKVRPFDTTEHETTETEEERARFGGYGSCVYMDIDGSSSDRSGSIDFSRGGLTWGSWRGGGMAGGTAKGDDGVYTYGESTSVHIV